MPSKKSNETAGSGPAPELSVVVALISGRTEDLNACLRALGEQEDPPSLEVIVPYDAPVATVASLAASYPGVRFLFAEGLDTAKARAGASREHHDALRTIGLKAARGMIVALTEDHAKVSPTWCRDMVHLLAERPQAAAVGGAVECGSGRPLSRAVYYCDFGRYQNPLHEGPAPFVSDSNVAYRRDALELVREVWEGDYHETLVHDALRRRGGKLWLTPRSTVWQVRDGLRLGGALRERFVWGRSYAATRVSGEGAHKRLAYAGLSFVLPPLLTWRLLRGVLARRREVGRFLGVLPLIVLLQAAWAAGEFAGYLTADPGRR